MKKRTGKITVRLSAFALCGDARKDQITRVTFMFAKHRLFGAASMIAPPTISVYCYYIRSPAVWQLFFPKKFLFFR